MCFAEHLVKQHAKTHLLNNIDQRRPYGTCIIDPYVILSISLNTPLIHIMYENCSFWNKLMTHGIFCKWSRPLPRDSNLFCRLRKKWRFILLCCARTFSAEKLSLLEHCCSQQLHVPSHGRCKGAYCRANQD